MTRNFGNLSWTTLPFTINVNVPFKGFVPGQSIPVNLNIDNQSGVNVRCVNVELKKVSVSWNIPFIPT